MVPLTPGKNLVIIGASGLIGGCISKSLYGSFNQVIGIARRPFFNPYLSMQINDRYSNISPKRLSEINPSHLVFSFSEPSQFKQYLDDESQDDTTLLDFKNFLKDLFLNTGIQHIFLISSGGAVYNSAEPITENTKVSPKTSYGSLKIELELILIDFCKNHSIDYTIFRLSNVYGNKLDGQISGGFINSAVEFVILGKKFEIDVNLQHFYRDFIHIDDLQFIFKNLILENSHTRNLIINIASGQSYNLFEVKLVMIELLRRFDLNLSCSLSNKIYIGPNKTVFDITLLKQLVPSITFTNINKGVLKSIVLAKNYYLN